MSRLVCSLRSGADRPAQPIAEFTVTDVEGIKPKSAHVESTYTPFGGRYAARAGQVLSLEGSRAARVIIIAFPNLAQARA